MNCFIQFVGENTGLYVKCSSYVKRQNYKDNEGIGKWGREVGAMAKWG